MKKLITMVFCLSVMLMTFGCDLNGALSDGKADEVVAEAEKLPENMTIKMLNVGQGDSILIQFKGKNYLVDTSDVDERDKLKNELAKANVSVIDKVILTHAHADHIGGMDLLLNKNSGITVNEVCDNGIPATSPLWKSYIKKISANNIDYTPLKAGDVVDLDGAQLLVLYPTEKLVNEASQKGYKHDPNNESVVMKLVYGDFSMLFTGDAEKQEETELVTSYGDELKSKVLKSPHHGSKTSSSAKFLKTVSPEAAVISCGINNDYGHPHEVTLNKYKKINVTTYETDKNGTITIETDGKDYTVKGEK